MSTSAKKVASLQSTTFPQTETTAASTPATKLESWRDRVVNVNGSVIILDVRNFRSHSQLIWQQDLADVTLTGGAGPGVYQHKIVKLGSFPHLVTALQAALLEDLRVKHEGRPDKSIPLLKGTANRVFCWMIATNHYRLRDVSRESVDTLISSLSTSSWFEVLNMRKALERVVAEAQGSIDLANRLMPTSNNANSRGINIALLQELTGLPITGPEVPMDVREALFLAARRHWPENGRTKAAGYPSGSALGATMECLNRLALHEAPVDCLPFLPFHSINAEMLRFDKGGGQTMNLSLDDAAKIFRACCTWIYDRAPTILQALSAARCALENSNFRSAERADKRATKAAREITAGIPWARELVLSQGDNSLARHLHMLYESCACMIGINHGRRVNEVVGEDLPYGVYFGCTRTVAGLLYDWRIDIYCEKNTQDYRSFPANALVVDAVHLLEKIFDLLRPLNTPPLERGTDVSSARAMKLFMTRTVSATGFKSAMYGIKFRRYLTLFLVDAGVDPARFHGQQWPFRRLFCSLNTNKYDHPELLALRDQLDHMNVGSTLHYQHDKVQRRDGGTVRETLGQHDLEAAGMLRDMRQARMEHLLRQILGMLNGQAIGGFFPRLVRRLAKSLATRADFRKADVARKANTIKDLLVAHGYLSTTMRHTTCVAEEPKATLKLAKCYWDGKLHREDASERTCSGCVHSMTAVTQIDKIRQLAKAAQHTSQDAGIPQAIRKQSSTFADDMERLAAAEEAIAQENKAMFEMLTLSWQQEVLAP